MSFPFKKPKLIALSVLAAAAAFSPPAAAHDYKAGALEIAHPWSRATQKGAAVAGGFMTIRNMGQEADRLVSVEAPFAASTELHESSVEDGVAKMRALSGGAEIPAGATVSFAPGGKHVMFLKPKQQLAKGEKLKATLTFEKAGRAEVEFAVEAPGYTPSGAAPADEAAHKGH